MKKSELISKQGKIALGAASFWPLVYVIGLVGLYFLVRPHLHAAGMGSQAGKDFVFTKLIPRLILPHMLAMMCLLGLLPFYIFRLVKFVSAKGSAKVAWVFLLLVGNIVILPVFWHRFIWKDQAKNTR